MKSDEMTLARMHQAAVVKAACDALAEEPLADELTRLIEEWRTGEGSEREEAWNLIADFTCCNCDRVIAALRAHKASI